MAMPASGCIGIITCPNSVACTSIAQAVDGNVTPPKSLSTLSASAGKTAPHAMTEFYNYNPAPPTPVNFTVINYNGGDGLNYNTTSCSNVTNPIAVGDCYSITMGIDLCINYSLPASTYSCYCIVCNSICIYGACITPSGYCSIPTHTFTVRRNDNILIYQGVNKQGYTCTAGGRSRICINSISGIVGNYSKGTTCTMVCRYVAGT